MVSVSEAARIKGVRPNSIRVAIRDGRLKGHKSGGVFLVDQRDLHRYEPAGSIPYSKQGKSSE